MAGGVRGSGTVDLAVVRGKSVLRRCRATYSEGRLVSVVDGGEDAADVSLTLTPGDADAMVRGELDASVAFMRGQMKMSGDFGVLLQVLPHMRGDSFAEVRTGLTA